MDYLNVEGNWQERIVFLFILGQVMQNWLNLICFVFLTYLFQTLFRECFLSDFWHYILIREVIWVHIKLIC
jgi:hypothetical protein